MIRAAFLATLLLAGGCAPTPPSNAFTPAVASEKAPEVRIGTIRGPSNAAARALKEAIGAELTKRGVEIVARPARGVAELEGRLSVLNEGNVTTFTWEWRLRRGGVALARPIVGFERVAGGSSNQWDGLAGTNAARIAQRVARKIALALNRPN